MNLQRINWKILIENPAQAQPDDFFAVFNSWIPNSPEIFIDVADYQHVHDGPVTLLVGHYVDYALDDSGRRRGLLYSAKREISGSNVDKLKGSLKSLFLAAKRLSSEPTLAQKVSFNTQELLLIINDRGICPNTEDSFKSLTPDLTKLFDAVYGAGKYTLKSVASPKERLSVQVKTTEKYSLDQLISKI